MAGPTGPRGSKAPKVQTSEDIAFRLAALMSAHSSHLFARASAGSILTELGLTRVYSNGSSVPLWSSMQVTRRLTLLLKDPLGAYPHDHPSLRDETTTVERPLGHARPPSHYP